MARMIPANLPFKTESNAEEKVFYALRNLLDDSHTIFHSFDLPAEVKAVTGKEQRFKGTEGQRLKGTERQRFRDSKAQKGKDSEIQRHRGAEWMIKTFRDLVVWQKAKDMVVVIYKQTGKFPEQEKFGVVQQIRRAAVSVPSNIMLCAFASLCHCI